MSSVNAPTLCLKLSQVGTLLSIVVVMTMIPRDITAEEATIKARPGQIGVFEKLIGKVTFDEEKLSHINPRYAGKVEEVYVDQGATVKRGQKLALIKKNTGLRNFTLRSPSEGLVITRDLSVGANVDTNHRSFLISDLSTLWVKIFVKPSILRRLSIGDSMRIVSSRNHNSSAKVFYKSPLLDSQVNSGMVYLELSNNAKNWLPGMYIEAFHQIESVSVDLTLPLSAVSSTGNNKPQVAIKTADGVVKRRVQIGISDFNFIEIKSGLKGNEAVVASYPYSSADTNAVLNHSVKGENEHGDH